MNERRFKGSFKIPAVATALQWESLAFLRAIGLLRLGYFGTVLIPIIAYFVQAWNIWATVNAPEAVLKLPMSMFAAFIGSILLSIAQLLNEIFCPKVIKIHGTLRGFQGYLREHVVNEQAIAEAARSARERWVEGHSRVRLPELVEEHRGRLAEVIADVLLEDEVRRASAPGWSPAPTLEQSVSSYRAVWDEKNGAFWPVRWIIALCYVLSGVIATWLIVQQIPRMFSLVGEAI